MKVLTFYSGSKGNVTLVASKDTHLLIDCGVCCMEMERVLLKSQYFAKLIDGILVTHEHSDHIAGLTMFTNKYNIPIYAHKKLAGTLMTKTKCNPLLIREYDNAFNVKDVEIGFIECSHDASFCAGYSIYDGKSKYCQVTDTGVIPDNLDKFVSRADLLLLESNHDEQMLFCGKYPKVLKERIRSQYGHLSNYQTAQFVKNLPQFNVNQVWLGHLSDNNNSVEMAFLESVNALKENGATEGKDITVEVIKHQGNRRCDI